MFGISLIELLSGAIGVVVLLVMASRGIMPFGMNVEITDNTDFDTLTDDDLGLGEQGGARPDGGDNAGTDPKKDNPEPGTSGAAADDAGAGKAANNNADNAGNEPKPNGDGTGAAQAAAAAGGEPEKLLAGRFKTTDDLAKGLLEIAKPLKYNSDFVQVALETAKETGNWAAVEKMYTALNKTLSAGGKAEGAPGAPGAQQDPEKGKPAAETQVTEKEAVQIHAVRETYEAVANSKIMRQLLQEGYKLPKGFLVDAKVTDEFMDTLKADGKAIEWIQLSQLMQTVYRKSVKEATEYLQAEAESKTHNETQKSAAVQSIKTFAQELGLPVTDEEITAFLTEAENDPYAVEVRNEVPFLKADGILNAWQMRNLKAIRQAEYLKGETTGRAQAAKDLAELGKRNRNNSSISNSGGSNRRQENPAVDLDNQDEIENMSDAELNGPAKK